MLGRTTFPPSRIAVSVTISAHGFDWVHWLPTLKSPRGMRKSCRSMSAGWCVERLDSACFGTGVPWRTLAEENPAQFGPTPCRATERPSLGMGQGVRSSTRASPSTSGQEGKLTWRVRCSRSSRATQRLFMPSLGVG